MPPAQDSAQIITPAFRRELDYRASSARQQAYALLRREDVTHAIETHHAEQAKHAAMKADEIITRLSQLARGGSGEWQQLRALNMLMRHLGMFASTKAPAGPPEPTLLDLLKALPPIGAPEPAEPADPPPADRHGNAGHAEPDRYAADPEDPEPQPPPPPRKRQPVDINELIAANNATRANFRYALERRHRFDDS